MDFLVNEGAAIYVYDVNDIRGIIEYIMDNPKTLDSIRSSMEKMDSGFRTDDIVCLGESLMEDYNYAVGFNYVY